MRLTKERINRLPVPSAGYDIYRDESRPGLGVRVTASGARSFIFEARAKGRNRRLTIGRFPALSVEGAWRKAKKHAATIADDKDPVAEAQRNAAKEVPLREALAGYLSSHDLKPRTRQDVDHAMKGLSDWMDRPVISITPLMVEQRHRRLGEKSPARANLTMRYLSAILNYAASKYADDEGRPLIVYNPVKRLSAIKAWYRVDRRRSVLREHELRPWWQAVEKMGEDPRLTHGREYRDYLITLLLTGLRRSEGLGLRWDQLDFKAQTLTVQDTKNREPHTLPLPDYLLSLLKARRRRSQGDFVFGAPDTEQISNLRVVTTYVERESAKILSEESGEKRPGLHITPHDLRRTFATIAERLDVPAYTLKRLLNHTQSSDVTAGYVIFDVERLRDPIERINNFILNAAGAQAYLTQNAISGD